MYEDDFEDDFEDNFNDFLNSKKKFLLKVQKFFETQGLDSLENFLKKVLNVKFSEEDAKKFYKLINISVFNASLAYIVNDEPSFSIIITYNLCDKTFPNKVKNTYSFNNINTSTILHHKLLDSLPKILEDLEKNSKEVSNFLKFLVMQQTGIPKNFVKNFQRGATLVVIHEKKSPLILNVVGESSFDSVKSNIFTSFEEFLN